MMLVFYAVSFILPLLIGHLVDHQFGAALHFPDRPGLIKKVMWLSLCLGFIG
jgi:hypothetical protein